MTSVEDPRSILHGTRIASTLIVFTVSSGIWQMLRADLNANSTPKVFGLSKQIDFGQNIWRAGGKKEILPKCWENNAKKPSTFFL